MQEPTSLQLQPPSLPKGGGTLSGMGESLSAAGPDGTASMAVPLPISVGRGFAPELALSYSSAAGNSAFGMGWDCHLPAFRVRTSAGTPRYLGEDTLLGPDGEVLVPVVDASGSPLERTDILGSLTCRVTRWQPRIVNSIDRIEYWQPLVAAQQAFWVILAADGQRHLFGRTPAARVSAPQDGTRIAEWHLEESVNPLGEHICYHWQADNSAGCDDAELTLHPAANAQRYLTKVSYGNIQPSQTFMLAGGSLPDDDAWLFHLVLDYGERSDSLYEVPPYTADREWACRPDSQSRYEYGFEVRTRRLCRQVLMYHRLQALAGQTVKDEEPALVSRLILTHELNASAALLLSVRQIAHEADGTPVTRAPLEFDYQRFVPEMNTEWQPATQLGNLNAWQPWQIVDLYGEGIPGILYLDSPGAWWYREPVRDAGHEDAIAYTHAVTLPQLPVQQNDAVLMDINGDGLLEWAVMSTALRGYHGLQPERTWTSFIPLSAIPLEYFHPQAQFADIAGAGLPDLTLIGPRSVRFWASERESWSSAEEMAHTTGLPLPVPGRDARHLVVFSDMAGSGKTHLTEISHNTVRYWPNLGHGAFGEPVTMPGFLIEEETFNPERVYMADLDGSGTSDLIYARHTHLELYLNESGNRFSAPLVVSFPDGVRFDDTCRLQVADIQGLGVSSILLTLPHMQVKHWRLDLVTRKPLLLNAINNNMGAETELGYRSSAQFWLDEKAQAAADGRTVRSYLPFAVHLHSRTLIRDEISGNCLTSRCVYRHGVWDSREREYRGFGCVEQIDTDISATASQGSLSAAPAPARKISWFATGVAAIDARLPDEFWSGDKQVFPGFTTRFTRFDTAKSMDEVIIPDAEQRYWLNRALKGTLLRSELYGEDGTALANVPYSVSEYRPQARLLSGIIELVPSVLPLILESRDWQYERIVSDPRCDQQTVLRFDELGLPCDRLSIAYPRRNKPTDSPYSTALPEGLFDASYDEQQQYLRMSRSRSTFHSLSTDTIWMPGLADTSRLDIAERSADSIPAAGVTLEWCLGSGKRALPGNEPKEYAGHTRTLYTGKNNLPDFPPLIAATETAELDTPALSAFDTILSPESLAVLLAHSGRYQAAVPFDNALSVYVSQQELTTYAGADAFYRPLSQRQTTLTGATVLKWDTHYCAIVSSTDAAGLSVHAVYDYRFLTPVSLRDSNDNLSLIQADALGRVITSRFKGTENGREQGYTFPEAEPVAFIAPSSVEEALALMPGIPVAGLQVYCPLSWMPVADAAQAAEEITEDGYVLRLASQRRHGRLLVPDGMPPHTMSIITDRYDNDPQQQLRQTVSFSDGFGRLLQAAVRQETGEAWQRNDTGALVSGESGPVSTKTDFRWAVTGRAEYDSKGQIVRAYQPYFLNSWQYVSDDSARRDMYADTHTYDPVGREVNVVTAKGGIRRTLFTPWFVVSEDENDTQS